MYPHREGSFLHRLVSPFFLLFFLLATMYAFFFFLFDSEAFEEGKRKSWRS